MVTQFLTVALVQLLALMTPGPDFFFVSQTALSGSRKQAMMGVLGICLGVMWWAGITLIGLHLVLMRLHWLHQFIMLAGGGYLCWMGYHMLRGALRRDRCHLALQKLANERAGYRFIKGLMTNLSNPKAVIYFGSIFSTFIGNGISVTERSYLFIIIVLETLLWFSLVACLFSLSVVRRCYQRLESWIDGLAGLLFLGFGLHLLIIQQTMWS